MTENENKVESAPPEETETSELKRWKTAFNTDNLAHAIIERETMIALIKDYYSLASKTAFPSLTQRAESFLKTVK